MLYVREQMGQFTWNTISDDGRIFVVRKIPQDRQDFFSMLMHQNFWFVPKIQYVGYDTGNGYCVIEDFINGKTLRQLQDSFTGQLELVRELYASLRDCLHTLSRHGIAHGDIKPENIMISDNIYLIDFEFGRVLDRHGKANSLGYTPLYCSEEQLHGIVSANSDIRALGITMMELYHGRHPFHHGPGNPEEIACLVANSTIQEVGKKE